MPKFLVLSNGLVQSGLRIRGRMTMETCEYGGPKVLRMKKYNFFFFIESRHAIYLLCRIPVREDLLGKTVVKSLYFNQCLVRIHAPCCVLNPELPFLRIFFPASALICEIVCACAHASTGGGAFLITSYSFRNLRIPV